MTNPKEETGTPGWERAKRLQASVNAEQDREREAELERHRQAAERAHDGYAVAEAVHHLQLVRERHERERPLRRAYVAETALLRNAHQSAPTVVRRAPASRGAAHRPRARRRAPSRDGPAGGDGPEPPRPTRAEYAAWAQQRRRELTALYRGRST